MMREKTKLKEDWASLVCFLPTEKNLNKIHSLQKICRKILLALRFKLVFLENLFRFSYDSSQNFTQLILFSPKGFGTSRILNKKFCLEHKFSQSFQTLSLSLFWNVKKIGRKFIQLYIFFRSEKFFFFFGLIFQVSMEKC